MSEYKVIELRVEDGTHGDAICEILENEIEEVKSALVRNPSFNATQKVHNLVHGDSE